MDELPVVHSLLRVLLRRSIGVTQVYGQLTYVDEGVLVGGGRVDGEELDQTVLHEANARLRAGQSELAVAHKGEVEFLMFNNNDNSEETKEE